MKKVLMAATVASMLTSSLVAGDDVKIPEYSSQATMYVGASYAVSNFGGTFIQDDIEITGVTTSDNQLTVGFGFISSTDNRWGIYYKMDSLNATDSFSNEVNYDLTIFGIDGQVGFSSLKSGNVLPYFGWGIGYGSVTDATDVSLFEFELSLGVNYTIDAFELTANVYNRSVYVDDYYLNNFELNGVKIGANFKF